VNDKEMEGTAEPRTSLADFLRDDLDLTGTHLGCEHGVCGACTVLLDGLAVRSCLMLAVQAEGRRIMTIEGLAGAGSGLAGAGSGLAGAGSGLDDGDGLHPLQQAFRDKHGLQCGFCTPGILLTAYAYLQEHPAPSHEEIREMLAGNLCRCTGYHFIVDAIAAAAEKLARGNPVGECGGGAAPAPPHFD
jgi:carbon-monoxide dehydrogenase small subunit